MGLGVSVIATASLLAIGVWTIYHCGTCSGAAERSPSARLGRVRQMPNKHTRVIMDVETDERQGSRRDTREEEEEQQQQGSGSGSGGRGATQPARGPQLQPEGPVAKQAWAREVITRRLRRASRARTAPRQAPSAAHLPGRRRGRNASSSRYQNMEDVEPDGDYDAETDEMEVNETESPFADEVELAPADTWAQVVDLDVAQRAGSEGRDDAVVV